MKEQTLKIYWKLLPDFSWSHLLLRIPLAVVFLEQGLSKLPFDPSVGAAFAIPKLVWWVVTYGEIAAGAGLLIGGLASLNLIRNIPYVAELGDLITRFSGITMCSISTGVIWIVSKPESLTQVILYDNLHVFLWVGGLYFALRGNWAVATDKKKSL
ncbi:DoxX family protein [Polynucleobacter brandtiae]|uniref:Putative oxidoreductase n=1 Tax=Polynucleobacter brandtiae TaxID=1938816 RepID=A0A2M8VZU0_9BURK|nr:DoxX family protein [Polynucleobacter brandtiae]PJI83376.1 putative oxidoreductase [Polynucleobacter brandtiae]